MAVSTRRQFKGAAVSTTTTNSLASGDTSVTIAATTGWPSGADPFYVVIDPGTSSEEKCRCTISGSTLTLTRAADDTTAVAHASGATIYPCATAVDFDEANKVASVLSVTAGAVLTLPTGTDTLVGRATTDTLTNKSLSVGQVTGLGSNVATFLATPSSANLAAALTDETGSGALNFGTTASGLVRVGGGTLSGAGPATYANVFTNTYNQYLISVTNLQLSNDTTVTLQLDVAGTPSTTGYVLRTANSEGASVAGVGLTVWQWCLDGNGMGTSAGLAFDCMLFNPALATPSRMQSSYFHVTTPRGQTAVGGHTVTTAYDGFRLILGVGTFTSGTVNIYGLALS